MIPTYTSTTTVPNARLPQPLPPLPPLDEKKNLPEAKVQKPAPVDQKYNEVLQECRKWLDIISGTMLDQRQHRTMIEETLRNHVEFVNLQWGNARKSVSAAGDYACIEWMGQASKFCDNLGREYIDCLGG
ncbi:hypothetical protein HUU40_27585, partial [candidate division KSB1 bacterium]|nr:hypothetical protein [candidate division KSB1 bacterium]